MAYIYTSLLKKVLHITERKRKSNIQHYCKSDDFRARFKVAKWAGFCHPVTLGARPARINRFSSDSNLEILKWVLCCHLPKIGMDRETVKFV